MEHTETNTTQGVDNGSAPRVALLAFGKRGYAFGAANLAASIRYYTPKATIHLLSEPGCLKQLESFHRALFNEIAVMPVEVWQTSGKVDPGKAKCRLRSLLPDGPWLFIDADSVVLQDITPFWNDLISSGKDFACEVIDSGPPSKAIDYSPWASPQAIAEKAGRDGATVYGINTTWIFLRAPGVFFDRVQEHYDAGTWNRNELLKTWGHSMPDELIYATTCTELDIDPNMGRRVFFGVDYSESSIRDIASKFQILTLYGNGRGPRTFVKRRYIDMVDPLLRRVYELLGHRHIYKVQYILNDKYLG